MARLRDSRGGAPSESRQRQVAHELDLIGAASSILGMAVGVFGPWETVLGLTSVSGFHYSSLDAGIILGCAITAAAILYRYWRDAGSALPLLGLGIIACTVGAYAWYKIHQDRPLGEVDWGVVVSTITGGALIVFALRLSEEIRDALN